MTPRRLVLIVGLALIVEMADLAGWVGWRRVQGLLAADANRAAAAIADSVLIHLPASAQLSVELDGRLVESASRSLGTAAFERIGAVQSRWMPVDPRGPRNRSRARRLAERPTEALDEARMALARFPTSPFELRMVAACELAIGERDAAIEHVADAEAIAGGYRLPPIDLTSDEREWLRLEALRRRLEMYPRRQDTSRVELARELKQRGATEAAEDLLRPFRNEPEVRIELARWDIERGHTDDAILRLRSLPSERGLPVSIRSRSLSVLAEAYSVAGDEEGALSAAREALRLQPESAAPYLALARVAEGRADLPGALAHLRRAWGVAPDSVQVLVSLARVADAAGATEDARLALERAVQIRQDDPAMWARLAEHHLSNGDLAAASLVVSRAGERFPDEPRLKRVSDRLRAELDRP